MRASDANPSFALPEPLRLVLHGYDDAVVCERCRVADSPVRRLRGLLGRRALPEGEGLLIRPAPAIHTWFMRFAIDAVFLDRQLAVVKTVENLRPWRAAACRGAAAVLELPAGACAERGVSKGVRLERAAVAAT
jgi:uncharacterized membrane protein (UPF0127 family)